MNYRRRILHFSVLRPARSLAPRAADIIRFITVTARTVPVTGTTGTAGPSVTSARPRSPQRRCRGVRLTLTGRPGYPAGPPTPGVDLHRPLTESQSTRKMIMIIIMIYADK